MTAADAFTEADYRDLLRLARTHYAFLSFSDAVRTGEGILWRHDVDISMHRALALARIEHDEGVRATYFVYLHSRFYSALEDAIVDRLRAIVALGHEVGVHFDSRFHGLSPDRTDELSGPVAAEAAMVESLAGARVVALSFHDPEVHGGIAVDDDEISGLVNAYGRTIRQRFAYCSDSNGYWRFASLRDELASRRHARLQVLTHPEWWVPEAMPPRDRIARAIDGRAASTAARYDAALAALGRENLR